MASGAGNRHTVKHFKEIKIQCAKQRIRSSLFRFKFAPRIESLLRLTEDFINRLLGIKFLIDKF